MRQVILDVSLAAQATLAFFAIVSVISTGRSYPAWFIALMTLWFVGAWAGAVANLGRPRGT